MSSHTRTPLLATHTEGPPADSWATGNTLSISVLNAFLKISFCAASFQPLHTRGEQTLWINRAHKLSGGRGPLAQCGLARSAERLIAVINTRWWWRCEAEAQRRTSSCEPLGSGGSFYVGLNRKAHKWGAHIHTRRGRRLLVIRRDANALASSAS